jgi:hypothetical protein
MQHHCSKIINLTFGDANQTNFALANATSKS